MSALTRIRPSATALKPAFSASSACLCHQSRSSAILRRKSVNWRKERSKIFGTLATLPFASSSRAAVNQMEGSLGIFLRALFSTFLAWSYSSKRARASQRSTLRGQHPSSTARVSNTRAESLSSNSTAAIQSLSESGISSSALRSTLRLARSSASRSAARTQRDTFVGRWSTACAIIFFPCSGGCSEAASSQISSLSGVASQPCIMRFRACWTFPARTSKRAAAIQAGACLGLDVIADLSSRRACRMSATSAV
mmetsp:Transcript_4822/g.14970  ORF Transcript_4822/g.14970 Transcript_4822/m.14970 type:complete len:253 (-) Transcript_4822:889-1647(-)